jgi:hypothetical protein
MNQVSDNVRNHIHGIRVKEVVYLDSSIYKGDAGGFSKTTKKKRKRKCYLLF